jgi:hypothetical protein
MDMPVHGTASLIHNSPSLEAAAYTKHFSQLASKRFITTVMPEDSKARIDRRLEAEARATDEILLGPSNREKTAIEFKVQAQLQQEDESRQMIGMVCLSSRQRCNTSNMTYQW